MVKYFKREWNRYMFHRRMDRLNLLILHSKRTLWRGNAMVCIALELQDRSLD